MCWVGQQFGALRIIEQYARTLIDSTMTYLAHLEQVLAVQIRFKLSRFDNCSTLAR